MIAESQMKDSGIEWIGEIPRNWITKKIKYVFHERKETNDPIKSENIVSLTHDRGVILYKDKGDIGNKRKDDIKSYKLVYPGDIVINSMNVIIGSSGLSNYFKFFLVFDLTFFVTLVIITVFGFQENKSNVKFDYL